MARPMLGDVELQQVQDIEIDEDRVLEQHGVPALEGDFLQGLGRRATQVALTGVLTGPDVGEGLKNLRDKFRAAEPVSFVTDITTATRVDQVLIEEMGVRELAGKPERFEYAFTLREYTPPPPPEEEPPPEIETPENPDEEIDQGVGTLVVEIIVEGQPGFDFSTVTVTVEGEEEDGTTLSRTLTNRTDNVWREENFPAGQYTVEAVAAASAAVTGSASADVRPGETSQITIALRPGGLIAKAFVIHFRFDKAFIEPCMRSVLRQVAQYARDHDQERLLIVGHTDKVGGDTYNQSLSERRARSAYAYLTFGRDRDARNAALAEWNALRQTRPRREQISINDSWGTHEYQFMLRDLGFYPGPVDGDHGRLTNDAVQAYRCQRGLPPGITVDDDVWEALIEDYLEVDPLGIPEDPFLPNAGEGCDGGVLKWLGCGEKSPLPKPTPTRRTAWRPYRRVEFLFTTAGALSQECRVPRPATLDLPPSEDTEQPAEPKVWCLGPGTPGHPCRFATRKCDEAEAWQWCIQPVTPGTITVEGSITREDGSPVANQEFVLTAPNGEFKAGESPRGEPQPARTDGNGEFCFPDMPVGFYTLEVITRRPRDYVLVRLDEEDYDTAKANAVCRLLSPDDNYLDVVVVDAPVMREIRLPVAAHLMTAQDSDGVLHSTSRDEASVQRAFREANCIWRQARIHFELEHIVRVTYEPPPAVQPPQPSQVSEPEFFFMSAQCSYPNVINVFFVQDVGDPTEAGFGTSFERGSTTPACAVEDLNDQLSAITLAHELGHFLNLGHPEDQLGAQGPFSHRLMHGGLKSDTQLIEDEVNTARSSQAAEQECIPLDLEVTGGAVQIGGSRSPNFVALRQDAAGPVTVEAQISPELLATGTLTMTGGEQVPGFPLRRNVPQTTGGRTTVEATFTMAVTTPSETVTRTYRQRVHVRVVEFSLEVETGNDVRRLGGPGSNIFVARQHALLPPARVMIEARLTPESAVPVCVPDDLVQWEGGDDFTEDILSPDPIPLDPFHRAVSRRNIAETTVSATMAGLTRTVVIRVVNVGLVNNADPISPAPFLHVARVRIEGIVNDDRGDFDAGDPFGTQQNSLVRARADVPSVIGNTLQATLTTTARDGTTIETRPITLSRQGDDRFVSMPLLAIPAAIRRADITFDQPQDIEVIRAQAGGAARLALTSSLAGLEVDEAPTSGRVVHIFAQAFRQDGATAGVTAADIRDHIERANRIWAQAGVEVRERSVNDAVPDPGGLLDLDIDPGPGRSDEEERLIGTHPDCAANPAVCPTQSAVATDLNVYYLRDVGGSAVGRAYGGTSVMVVEGPNASLTTLAHEIGHQLIINWACADAEDREHKDTACDLWPEENIMHRFSSDDRTDVDQSQVENILQRAQFSNNTHPRIVFEP